MRTDLGSPRQGGPVAITTATALVAVGIGARQGVPDERTGQGAGNRTSGGAEGGRLLAHSCAHRGRGCAQSLAGHRQTGAAVGDQHGIGVRALMGRAVPRRHRPADPRGLSPVELLVRRERGHRCRPEAGECLRFGAPVGDHALYRALLRCGEPLCRCLQRGQRPQVDRQFSCQHRQRRLSGSQERGGQAVRRTRRRTLAAQAHRICLVQGARGRLDGLDAVQQRSPGGRQALHCHGEPGLARSHADPRTGDRPRPRVRCRSGPAAADQHHGQSGGQEQPTRRPGRRPLQCSSGSSACREVDSRTSAQPGTVARLRAAGRAGRGARLGCSGAGFSATGCSAVAG